MSNAGSVVRVLPSRDLINRRDRSTFRAKRLLVPSANTEEALVRTAGATINVKTAKGLSTGITELSYQRQITKPPDASRLAARPMVHARPQTRPRICFATRPKA